jgi:uncharacterized membrane protein YedE/YeeE
MEEINLEHIRQWVLIAIFGVGFLFGAISQKSHFCTMGAVSDIVNFGDWGRMRMWILAIAVAALGLQTLIFLGKANVNDTIFVAGTWSWLSAMVGGLLFGIGMVLASGCGSKTLIRLGAGNLKALFVFVVLGLTAYMTLKGVFGVFRVNYLDPFKIEFGASSYLPQLLDKENGTLSSIVMFGIPLALLAWVFAKKAAWSRDILLGGVGIGLCVVASWWAVFQLGFLPEHPETLEAAYLGSYNNRAEGMSFVAPYAYTLEWLMFYSDITRVLTVGVVSCLGVIAGSLVTSLITREFRWEAFNGVEDMANHTAGAVMMGIGGVMAMGCTVGQGLSGVSTLSLTSWITLLFIILGAVAALKYQVWRVEQMA